MTIALFLLAASVAQQPQTTPPTPPRTKAAAEAPAAGTVATAAPDLGPASSAISAGLKAYRQLRLSQAEVEFRKAVEADPNSAAAHYYLGYTYYKMGEPTLRMDTNKQKAKEEFAKAFELDPAFKPTWR